MIPLTLYNKNYQPASSQLQEIRIKVYSQCTNGNVKVMSLPDRFFKKTSALLAFDIYENLP